MNAAVRSTVALVTGGASGIGRAVVLLWAAAGHHVVIADRDAEGGEALANQLRDGGQKASFVCTDVGLKQDCDALFQHIELTYGWLDLALNSAGIAGPAGRIADVSPDDWRHAIEVNLFGVYRCLAAELRLFVAGGGGCAVNVSSVYGQRGVRGGSAYAAAKHAVIGLTRSAALEYGARGIRVNAVCPGFIETPFTTAPGSSVSAKALDAQVERIPSRRMGTPAEVASVVLWLASDAASYVNGATIDIDGGFLAA